MDLLDDGWCFVCGKNNPEGLQIDWRVKDREVGATFVAPKKFQGYVDILHGGIIATLLDEAMGHLLWKLGYKVVLGELNVRCVKMIKTGEKIFIHGGIEKESKKIIFGIGEIRNVNNDLVATGKGKYVVIK